MLAWNATAPSRCRSTGLFRARSDSCIGQTWKCCISMRSNFVFIVVFGVHFSWMPFIFNEIQTTKANARQMQINALLSNQIIATGRFARWISWFLYAIALICVCGTALGTAAFGLWSFLLIFKDPFNSKRHEIEDEEPCNLSIHHRKDDQRLLTIIWKVQRLFTWKAKK